ncbi:MAG: putative toxin-antitoxin system toxin component, PIN family [Thermomicrobiales bacterium]
MVSAVLDTVVFVRCMLNPRSIWGRVVFDRAVDYRLVVSPPVIAEVLDVLGRPAVTRKFRFVAGLDFRALLSILGNASVVQPLPIPATSRDPNDDKFLATALAANADYLVSEDNDLLVLGEYQGGRIVDARTFLNLLEGDHSAR